MTAFSTAGGVNADDYQSQRLRSRGHGAHAAHPHAGPQWSRQHADALCSHDRARARAAGQLRLPPGMGGRRDGRWRDGRPQGMPAGGYAPDGMGQTVSYDNPQMPGYAWPSYAAYPNYAALTYPQQYSPTAWPYIGPFYPYPQVPLGWRKVTLEWDDGWWFLDFKDCKDCH